jgi:putative PIG3 family NAD(P)H quinone oxidoreductase
MAQESRIMTLPKTMMAVAVERTAAGPKLYLKEMLVPHPGPGQILIKVASAGVNRADILQVEGHHPPPPGAPETPGLEVSGTIIALDQAATGFRVGDEVTALLTGGGYAEYAVASALCTLPVPKSVSVVDAGGLPEVYFTVWSNVFDTARLKAGESFLVHGGSSGIGTAAIQLMHARGHQVFTTAGSAEKCAACEKLGATRSIGYRNEDFVTLVKADTNGKGVDVILDMVGGDYVMRNLHTLARGGRLVNIAYQKGAKVEVDFRIVQARLLSLAATHLRGRPDSEKALIRDHLAREVWPLFETGRLKPVTYRVFPLTEAGEAHQAMRESRHIGKILLAP